MIKVSDYIMKRLHDIYGVDCVFMVSGGGAMHLNDSVGKYMNYVCNHNEQASGIAAEGYARVNQKLSVVNVTTGPGGLNALNGVFASMAFTRELIAESNNSSISFVSNIFDRIIDT